MPMKVVSSAATHVGKTPGATVVTLLIQDEQAAAPSGRSPT